MSVLPFIKLILAKATLRPWSIDKEAVSIYAPNMMRVADIRGWGTLKYRRNGEQEMDANAILITVSANIMQNLVHVVERAQQAVDAESLAGTLTLNVGDAGLPLPPHIHNLKVALKELEQAERAQCKEHT